MSRDSDLELDILALVEDSPTSPCRPSHFGNANPRNPWDPPELSQMLAYGQAHPTNALKTLRTGREDTIETDRPHLRKRSHRGATSDSDSSGDGTSISRTAHPKPKATRLPKLGIDSLHSSWGGSDAYKDTNSTACGKPNEKKSEKDKNEGAGSCDEDEDEDDIYNDNDDLMGSGSDWELLQSLPELDRERILSERAEKRDLRRERRAIERKLRESGIALTDSGGKKAENSKLSKNKNKKKQKQKCNENPSTVQHKTDALVEYNATSKMIKKEVEHEVTLEHLKRVQITRDSIAKWCFASFFDTLARGAFVRVSIGENQGSSVYRVAEVIGLSEHKRPYTLNRVMVNTGFLVRHGANARVFMADVFSNSPFTENEYQRWRAVNIQGNIAFPNLKTLEVKFGEIEAASSYVFSESEVAEMVRRKQALSVARRNFASEKAELLRQRDVAHSAGKMDRVRAIEQQIDELRAMSEEARSKSAETKDPLRRLSERPRKLPIHASDSQNRGSVRPVLRSSPSSDLVVAAPQSEDSGQAQKSFEELFASAEGLLNIDL